MTAHLKTPESDPIAEPELVEHEAATTDVHGIADTALLVRASEPFEIDLTGADGTKFVRDDGSVESVETVDPGVAPLDGHTSLDVDLVSGEPTVTFTSIWGIDSNGDPYLDPAGAADGEDALLVVSPTGAVVLVQPPFDGGDVALAVDLADEVTARTAADTALQANITAEATARAAGDAATDADLASEASTRAAADTANAAAAAAAQATADAALPKAGGTMTGAIVLAGNPGANLQATPKQYVDSEIAAAIAALINGAPGALDTLKEIADQLATDETAAASLTTTVAGKLAKASNLADLVDAVAARTNLGLGTAATHAHGDYDAAGAAAAAQAASQPLDSDLTDFAALTPANDDFPQRKAGHWTNRTPAQAKTDLGLVKGDVGLGNVDNTADTAKPVSTAQQTALDLKADLASPALTGNPTAPTQSAGNNSPRLATTAYADGAVATEATARATGDTTAPLNTQTGDYTLVLGDAGKVVRMNKATAQVFTIPPQSSVAWAAETVINVRRVGAGCVTITPGSGVTIPNRIQTSGAAARTIANQYGEATLHRVASDVWELVGDLA